MLVGMLIPIFLCAIFLSIPASLATTYTHVNLIQENGTRFRQRVDVDRRAQIEVFTVPAHNGLLALKELYDFKRGLVLRCHPARRACFLAEFDRKNYESPAKLEKNLRLFERKHRSPRREEKRETIVKENLVIVDVNPVTSKNLLTPAMRKLLGSYKLYREVKLPRNATVIKDTGKPMVAPKRTKRSVVDCTNKCRYNASPVVKYVRTPGWGRSCERTRHCVNGRCTWKHLTHRNMYKCCCCPEHTTSQQCYKAWGKCTYHRYYG